MTVFRYDKTFEGLLTAVFDAYARRSPHPRLEVVDAAGGGMSGDRGGWFLPDALLTEVEPAPLFTTEEHTVVTDLEKSGRVWRALEARLPQEVCNVLMMSWLSEEPGVDMMLVRYMRRVFDEPSGTSSELTCEGSASAKTFRSFVATDFSDPDILRVKQLAHKVSNERLHLMQFTRFQKGIDGESSATDAGLAATYFAPVAPRYNALPLVIPYFRDRFRDQKWLIYDIKRRYGFYYDLQTVTEITMEDDTHLLDGQLDAALMAEDEKLFQSLWKTYFNSMAIAERINPRLQRQHMPRRFWGLLTEMQ